MKLSLRQIEIFLNVVELGHLTQVAKEIGVSQSAISMSIKELENILGRSLFDRINKKLILNELGRTFHSEIESVYRRLEDIERGFRNTEDKGIIRVGASTTIVDYLMPSIVCKYMNQYPSVKLQLEENKTQHISMMIKNGELDIAFVERFVKDSDLISEVVGGDELIVVTANPEYSVGKHNIEDLMSEKWVLKEKGSASREAFLEYIKEQDGCLNIFLELGHTETIKSILRNGKTFTCISKLAVDEELKKGVLFKVDMLKFKCERKFYTLHHKDKYQSELYKNFLNFYKDIISNSKNCKL